MEAPMDIHDPAALDVDSRMRAHARARPNAAALGDDVRTLSWDQLDRRVNRVADTPDWGFNRMYSSGTTGTPKGILQSRGYRAAVLNHALRDRLAPTDAIAAGGAR